MPSGGFGGPPPRVVAASAPTSHHRRRWPVVVIAVVVAVAVGVAAVVLVREHSVRARVRAEAAARAAWQPPAQLFVASSLRQVPVPGWRTRLNDRGLVAADNETALLQFTTTDLAVQSDSLIGYVGDRAYFFARRPGPEHPYWWVVGLNIANGTRLFAPIRLTTSLRRPACMFNGPETLLCHTGVDIDPTVAWVIDAQSGVVTYTGPGDFKTTKPRVYAAQAGRYAVFADESGGIYGIGAHAEKTWHIPGSEDFDVPELRLPADPWSVQLAVQRVGLDGRRVFSPKDGTIIEPSLGAGMEQQMTLLYPGGFAAEIVERSPRNKRVDLFDTTGRLIRQADNNRQVQMSAQDLPVAEEAGVGWTVYSAEGAVLLRGPEQISLPRLIGDKLFGYIGDDNEGESQFDLRTGVAGNTCQYSLYNYIAGDGKVAILEFGNGYGERVGIQAYDLATCERLWDAIGPTGTYLKYWQINTTLVRLSDDGTTLESLTAPK